MITTKGISISNLIKWTGSYLLWLLVIMSTIAGLYHFKIITIVIPWLPISVIGTAVAFYVGFKNNQAYDRMWEARKNWGGIVNESRNWGMITGAFISNLFAQKEITNYEIYKIKQRLVYRHFAWLYAHRRELLVSTSWEHISQKGHVSKTADYFQKKFGVGLLLDDEISKSELKLFLTEEEYNRLTKNANTATQIINEQSRDLAAIREAGLIDDFRHMEMINVLKSFYELQGKNERIKKFPFPRPYANMSRYFVGIFIVLLPFSMIPQLMETQGGGGIWISIAITVIISWVYIMMEVVGDYSENPFQGMANDIPMFSLCRTIEIDLREMLGEKDLPAPIEPKNGILM